MKSKRRFIYISFVLLICFITTISFAINSKHDKNIKVKSKAPTYTSEKTESVNEESLFVTLNNDIKSDIKEKLQEIVVPEIVYDGMTLEELANKLNKFLTNELSGKGLLFATHTLEMGVDPYVAVAIVLHETGCSYKCSTLASICNNVGGMKTGSRCGNSEYGYFDSLDTGIIAYIDNLYNNYYALGLNTVELIGPKYAESSTWVSNVNNYIAQIRAS